MDYTSTYAHEDSGIFATIGVFGTLIYLAIAIVSIAGMWKAFEKAGHPGWSAIIPIYNIYIMIKIVGKPTIWLLFMLIPCVNIVFAIWLTNLLSKSFGKNVGFTIGLLLLGFIFWPILGFGSARYIGPSAAEAKNPFDPNNFGNFNNPNPPTSF